MFDDIVSGFAHVYIQNGQWLPKTAQSVCALMFAVGAFAFPEPIVDGVMAASNEMSAHLMKTMQPIIDNISTPAGSADTDQEVTAH